MLQMEFYQTPFQPTFGEVAVLHRPGFLVVGVDENSWDVIPLLKIIWWEAEAIFFAIQHSFPTNTLFGHIRENLF